MCLHVRRKYRVVQLTPASAGMFAAAAALNALSPADWSVSQEAEVAVGELTAALQRTVPETAEAAVDVVVHANHIEVRVECDHPDWVTESVRVRPRRPFETAIECAVEHPGPPPARPALWPELARPRGTEDWSETYAALAEIVQSVRGGRTDLTPILDAIGRGIVSSTCFTIVATSLVVDDGVQKVSVIGSDEARDALLGVVEDQQHWNDFINRGASWGTLRFCGPEDALPPNTVMTTFPPTRHPFRPGDVLSGTGWHPENTLAAPLYVDGRFIGALSVDLPAGAPRPTVEDLSKLEVFAEHAAVAIDRARIARIAG